MLVTLNEMKTYLGISLSDVSQDSFLTSQITEISEVIENYCGRKFLEDEYIQTFYFDDYDPGKKLLLFHYPVSSIASILEDSVATADEYRLHKPTGTITKPYSNFFYATETVIQYTAGYAQADIPQAIRSAVFSLVEERYNKKNAGIDLNFGSDVQRISVPGTISVDFDYTLTTNERSSAFGKILGSYANVLDFFRSERGLIGNTKIEYVEEA